MNLRQPEENDWPALLALANESLAGMQGAPDQREWLENRRSFPTNGTREHLLMEKNGQVVGYAAVEHRADSSEGGYRLFLVTAETDRAELGEVLLDWLEARLADLGARSAWFIEFADDAPFIRYLQTKDYRESRRFQWEGWELVVLSRSI